MKLYFTAQIVVVCVCVWIFLAGSVKTIACIYLVVLQYKQKEGGTVMIICSQFLSSEQTTRRLLQET